MTDQTLGRQLEFPSDDVEAEEMLQDALSAFKLLPN